MAASPAGSSPIRWPASPFGIEPGHDAAPAPRAELSRTRLAISSGTPSAAEGCARASVSGLEFPLAARFCFWPGREPLDWAENWAGILGRPGPDIPKPPRPSPASAGMASRPPRHGKGRKAGSPSVGESSAGRIDLAPKRIGIQLGLHGRPCSTRLPEIGKFRRQALAFSAPLVILYPTGCPAGAACAGPLRGA